MKTFFFVVFFLVQSISFAQVSNPTQDQIEAAKLMRDFGMLGNFSFNCQDINSMTIFKVEGNKARIQFLNPQTKYYSIIDKAKLLNENQIYLLSNVFNVDTNESLNA